ncbi:MAG: flagellar export protein FliJ [Eisenbergiella sp.]
MARRKKNMTWEEELEFLTTEITAREAEIKSMKARKKEIEKELEAAELQKLYAAIKESGKTVEDVISALN